MNHLESYLTHLHDARATGEAVKETSFYPALSALLNAVGAELKPKVKCVINIKNRGAGIPDGGLFTAEQLRANDAEAVASVKNFNGQIPARGVVEVKGTKEDVRRIAAGEQVEKYLKHYGLVLVTNLREFLLVERDVDNKARVLEGYALAEDEKDFWATSPGKLAAEHEERFTEYLRRVMLSAAPLNAPESLAWFLASYARDAKSRIERAELPSLQSVRKALEEALGLQFEGDKGEAFFRSTLVQTLFYGVFSALVLWCKSDEGRNRANKFRWKEAENVYVLDPCCGTGAYLVEVLKRIKRTVDEEGADALSASDLKEAAMSRVFGFEILSAPFVVAHMQLG